MQLAVFAILLLCVFWLLIITLYFYQLRKQQKLFMNGSSTTLTEVLAKHTKDIVDIEEELRKLRTAQNDLEEKLQFPIQKIGLLRFNPFRDTGGEQSFILSLLDANDTGIVLSSLYSRSGTRWYAKKVIRGEGKDYELSDEEKKAIKLAKVLKNQ
jgi:hypothetical protein